MVRRARPAVVRIQSSAGGGSGVIFETQGQTAYVITNQHVVERASVVSVTVNDSATYQGTVLGTDSVRDLAVVRICCGSFSKLSFGDASRLEPGDEIIAIGYALGIQGEATITRGIISAIRYDSVYRSDVIQTDAAINPGNSGGPMLSMSGEVLGINTFGADKSVSEGLNFAISGTTVQQRIPVLKTARAAPTPTPTRRPSSTPAYGGTPVASAFAPLGINLHWVCRYDHTTNQLQVYVPGSLLQPENLSDLPENLLDLLDGGLPGFDSTSSINPLTHVSPDDIVWMYLAEDAEFQGDMLKAGYNLIMIRIEEGPPRSSPTPTPQPWTSDSFGLASGELRHDPSDGIIETEWANVAIADGFVGAEFINPYSARSNSWDYGFIFRAQPQGPRIHLVVTSYGRWDLDWRETPNADTSYDISSGTLKAFDTSAGGRNSIAVFAFEERGLLFVNGEFISMLDLSYVTQAGDVAIITGGFTGNEVDGAVTRFEYFIGDSLIKQYGPSSGRLEHKQGTISGHSSSVWTRDLVAEADFINPRGSDWDYGFLIRNPEFNRLEVIGITDEGWWFHKTRDVNDAEYTTVASGYLRGADFRDRSRLLLHVFGDSGRFFVNGQLVARLDLFHNLDHGRVSLMGGLFNDHTGEPEFENFNVWVP